MGSPIQTAVVIVWGLLLGQLAIAFAAPQEAIVPAAAAAPIETVIETPPIQPAVAVPVETPEALGNGFVTEHKSPDGSTLTITRFNGPLPASAVQNLFAPSPFPFGGYMPFGNYGPYGPYVGYGYGGPAPPRQAAGATPVVSKVV